MSDSNLTIGASFDKSQLDAAIADGTTAIQKLPESFGLAFDSLSASAKRAMDQISSDTTRASANVTTAFKTMAAATVAHRTALRDVAAATRLAADQSASQTNALNLLAAAQERAAQTEEALAAARTEAAGAGELETAATEKMQYSMAYGTARIGSYAAGVGSLGYALGSVLGRMEGIAPVLSAAFDVAAAGAFLDIVVNIGDKIKTWYDNTVLLASLNQQLMESAESAWSAAAAKNWEYVQSVMGALRATGNEVGALNELRSHIQDKPLKIDIKAPKDDQLAELETSLHGISKLFGEIKGSNTLGSGEALISPISAKIDAAKGKIAELNQYIKQQQEGIDLAKAATYEGAVAGPDLTKPLKGIENAKGQIQSLQTAIQGLQAALNQVASAKGTAGNDIAAQSGDVARKAAEAAQKAAEHAAEAQRKLAQQAAESARVVREGLESASRAASQYDEQRREAMRANTTVLSDQLEAQMEATRKAIADEKGALSEYYSQQQRNIQSNVQLAISSIQRQAVLHQISAKQEEAAMAAAYKKEYDSEVAMINARLAALSENDDNYLTEHERLLDELQEANNRYQQNLEHAKSDPGQQKAPIPFMDQIAVKGITTMGDDFSKMMDGVMQGTQRLSVAWRRMWSEMAAGWASAMVEMAARHLAFEITKTAQASAGAAAQRSIDNISLARQAGDLLLLSGKWIAHELGITTAHTAGAAARAVTDATSAATSASVHAATAMSQVISDAAVAAAGAYAAISMIPIIGPELAPGVAAGTMAQVLALAPMASAEGGQWTVPINEQLTMLHRNEMVLPAAEAEGLRNLVGAGRGGGHTIHVHNHYHVNAIDGRGMKEALREHSDAVAAAVHHHLRRANRL